MSCSSMIIHRVLLCLSISVLMVTANPLMQRIPVQTCPFLNSYQQDVYKNLFPDIPVVIQKPTNNVGQQSMTHHHISQPVRSNQPVNTLNNQLNQIFVDRILSNPGLQTLLDPNSKIYNQKGIEVRRKAPARVNTGVVPNIVNNYIILPPEFLEQNYLSVKSNSPKLKSKAKQGNEGIQTNKNNAGSTRRKSQQRKSENSIHKVYIDTNKNNHRQNEKYRNKYENDAEADRCKSIRLHEINEPNILKQSSKRQHIRTHKIMPDYDDVSFEDENNGLVTQNQITKETIRKNPKPTILFDNNEFEGDFCNCKQKENDLKEKTKSVRTSLKILKEQPLKESTVQVQKLSDNEKEIVPNENRMLIDKENTLLSTNFGLTMDEPIEMSEAGASEKRLPRNSRDEAVIKDFRRKFPNIPEYTARSLLAYMKKQLQNQQFGSSFYYPNGNFPLTFQQFYRMPQFSNGNHNNIAGSKRRTRISKRRKPQRSNRRNQNKKNNCTRKEQNNKTSSSNCETVIELIPTIIDNNNRSKNILSITENPQLFSARPMETVFEKEEPKLDLPKFTSVSKLVTEVPKTREINDSPLYETQEVDIVINNQKDNPITVANFAPICNTNNIIHELGTEDKIPIIFENGIIEDYYPDFTADNEAYFASDEDCNLRTLNDDRYHYMTSRKDEMEELNRERRKYEEQHNMVQRPVFSVKDKGDYKFKANSNHEKDTEDQSSIEDTIQKPFRENHKSYENIFEKQHTEKRLKKTNIDDYADTEFQTPPGLIKPDFRTKRVSKNSISAEPNFYDQRDNKKENFSNKVDLEELKDKIASHSNAKFEDYNVRVRPVNDIKRVTVHSKAKNNDVETVYARSKIAKYGQVSDSEENVEVDSKTRLSEDEVNNDQIQYATDGNTMIVIAKSLNYPDEYYW